MGTIERIRQISPYAIALFIIVFVIFMAVGFTGSDILFMNLRNWLAGNTVSRTAVGSVEGKEIAYAEFDNEVKTALKDRQAQLKQQGADMELKESQFIVSQWRAMVENILMEQAAEEAGIDVTVEQIRDIMIDNPPDFLKEQFRDSTGRFDKAYYLQMVTNPEGVAATLRERNVPEEQIEKWVTQFVDYISLVENSLKSQKLREGLQTLVTTSSSFISPLHAKMEYYNQNAVATANVAYLNANMVPQSEINFSEAEIQDYYDKHRQQFKTEAKRKLKYASFPIVPSKEDSTKAREKVREIAKELSKYTEIADRDSVFDVLMAQYGGLEAGFQRVDKLLEESKDKMEYLSGMTEKQVIGPVLISGKQVFVRKEGVRSGEGGVVKASHILFEFNENKDSAKAEAEKILRRAKSGEDFAELAKEFSKGPSAPKGGDLGFFSKEQMVAPFSEAAFAAEVGEVVGPIETRFGWHVIKVFEKKTDEISYSEIVIEPKMTDATRHDVRRAAQVFAERVRKGENPDSVAKDLGTNVAETQFFEKDRPVLGSQYLTTQAFEKKIGQVLDPHDLENYGIVVAIVSDGYEKGFQPLEEVRPNIERKVRTAKRMEALKPQAEKIYSQLKSRGSLAAVTEIEPKAQFKDSSEIKANGVTPFGRELKVAEVAFDIDLNKMSGLIEGEQGYYVIKVIGREVPTEGQIEQNIAQMKQQLSAQAKSTFYTWFSKLQEDAKIVDNRSNFYRDY